jgi:septal ring factor EnvC (AmiA/AmiB activator)
MDTTDNHYSSLSNTSPSECSEPDNEASLVPKGQHRTQAEKKMDRILANRRSARRSRERRKKLQQNLEVSVSFLGRQNEELSRENNMLKQELRVLINLVNQMDKHASMSNDLGTENLLQQVRLASASNPAVNTAPQAPQPSNNINNQTSALLSGRDHGFNSMSPEQVLALSQLLSNQNRSNQKFI